MWEGDGETERWRDGEMEGWRDGEMEGRRDEEMEGWREEKIGSLGKREYSLDDNQKSINNSSTLSPLGFGVM